jgi:hypothetical protein
MNVTLSARVAPDQQRPRLLLKRRTVSAPPPSREVLFAATASCSACCNQRQANLRHGYSAGLRTSGLTASSAALFRSRGFAVLIFNLYAVISARLVPFAEDAPRRRYHDLDLSGKWHVKTSLPEGLTKTSDNVFGRVSAMRLCARVGCSMSMHVLTKQQWAFHGSFDTNARPEVTQRVAAPVWQWL